MDGTDMSGSEGPLSGVRVIDITINVLGPFATQILGDLGADVIKVETPAGDDMRRLGAHRSPDMAAHFVNMNRSKRSIVLNLKTPEDSNTLMRLVDTADVFVHNMRAAAAERLGIGPDAIRARNPKIIYAYATGYKKDGPKRDRPAYDDVIQGESGLAGLIGAVNGEPRFVPYAICDKLCGVYLASSIGAALFRRERTGQAQTVHVPMLETMVSFNIADHMWQATFSDRPEDTGYPRMLTPHRRPYPTKDGHICLLATTDGQWVRLFDALERPDLAADPRFATIPARTKHIDELYSLLGEVLLQRSTAEWIERFDARDLPNAPVNGLSDLIADEYFRQTGFMYRYEHPTDGTYTTMAYPIDFSGSPAGMKRPPPRLGEHTDEILEELDRVAASSTAPQR
jgi:crotonobetainyl-CoA:carnitine CoA-transferase CaiB-like acyl-CoA transferase